MAEIDLMRAVPPNLPRIGDALSHVLNCIAQDNELGVHLRTNRPGGSLRDRDAAANWLSFRLGYCPSSDQVFVTNGTQSCLLLLMPFLVSKQSAMAVESLTYPVTTNLARRSGVRLTSIEIDDLGMIPDDLARAASQDRISALFLNPTVHNPTTAVMPETRRTEIIAIARKNRISIVEDDVLGRIHGRTPKPFAALAPDLTWYLAAMAKSVTLGLRISFMVCPTKSLAQGLFSGVATMSSWFPSAIAAEVASRLIENGSASEIERAILTEIDARVAIVHQKLENTPYRYERGGLHIWLPCPNATTASDLEEESRELGVRVRNFKMFRPDADIDHTGPWGVRIAITNPTQRTELATGLEIINRLHLNQRFHA